MTPLPHYLIFSALLFSIGLGGAIMRRNVLVVLMGLELMLTAANVSLAYQCTMRKCWHSLSWR